MKLDVFISYSRKDIDVASRICKAFDKAGVSYFVDSDGIGGEFEFPEVLAKNIDESALFLFLASEHSYKSNFAMTEIAFAFKKKERNRVIPYVIDNSALPITHEYIFSGINWRNINEHPIETTLVSDILKLLGREGDAERLMSCKTYKIGDYYDDGRKRGVVFEVSEDGKHGKIVSLEESQDVFEWSSDVDEQCRRIDLSDMFDGTNNMRRIKQIPKWHYKYPAFAWCIDLGDEWYLPAIGELVQLTLNEEVRAAVNCTLKGKGVEIRGVIRPSLCNKICNAIGWSDGCANAKADSNNYYWSSTEMHSAGYVYVAFRGYGDVGTIDFTVKGCKCRVRAVSAF